MQLSGKLDSRNPFNFLALGDVALANGRVEEARRLFRRAQRLEGAATDAMAALGEAALAEGDRRQAQRWLHKAAARDAGNERVVRLAAQLAAAARGQLPAAVADRTVGGAGAPPQRALLTPAGPRPPQARVGWP
jgi:Flp pilus assembly protein TadD